MKEKFKIEISSMTIVNFFLIAIFLFFLYYIREVWVIVLISLILAAAFQPLVKGWSKIFGRTFSVILLLLIFIALVVGFVYLVIPPLANQSVEIIKRTPDFVDRFKHITAGFPYLETGLSSAIQNLSGITGNIISITANFFGALVGFVTVIILMLYFLLDEKFFTNLGQNVIAENKAEQFFAVVKKISTKVGSWLRGQLLLSLVIGVMTFIGLKIIGIPFATMLAVLSGIFEIIPIAGPVISGIIAALVALTISPIAALIVLLFYVVVQQVENNLLVPKIMERAVGLPPAIIIVAILIGGKLYGILGALLAVPILAILYVIWEEWPTIKSIFSSK